MGWVRTSAEGIDPDSVNLDAFYLRKVEDDFVFIVDDQTSARFLNDLNELFHKYGIGGRGRVLKKSSPEMSEVCPIVNVLNAVEARSGDESRGINLKVSTFFRVPSADRDQPKEGEGFGKRVVDDGESGVGETELIVGPAYIEDSHDADSIAGAVAKQDIREDADSPREIDDKKKPACDGESPGGKSIKKKGSAMQVTTKPVRNLDPDELQALIDDGFTYVTTKLNRDLAEVVEVRGGSVDVQFPGAEYVTPIRISTIIAVHKPDHAEVMP